MLILFLKSKAAEPDEQIPLPEKLRLILTARVKEAKTGEELERAEKELAKFSQGTDRGN